MKDLIKAITDLVAIARSDFKTFAFIVSVVLNGFSLWFCWTLVTDLNTERDKNDTTCETKVEKKQLAFDIELKIVKDERDTLKKLIVQEREDCNSTIIKMKDEQKSIYERILKWKK